jgi:hypothetical protein
MASRSGFSNQLNPERMRLVVEAAPSGGAAGGAQACPGRRAGVCAEAVEEKTEKKDDGKTAEKAAAPATGG